MSTRYRSLTRTQVDRIRPPTTGILFVRDADQPGFGVKVSPNGTKSFFVEARIRGNDRTRRKVVGRYPRGASDDVKKRAIESAKAKALVYLSHFQQGKDPIGDGKVIAGDDQNPSVERILNDYIETKSLKSSTAADYRKVLRWGLSDWLNVPAAEITRDDIVQRHRALGKRSHAQANYAMRVLRALFNFAIESYRDARGQPIVEDNPVILLSRVKAWYRIPRRRTVIKRHDLPAWYGAVTALTDPSGQATVGVVRDYFLFLLFTGMRRTEAASLRRGDVDLQDRTFVATDTKNREDHTLPISDPVWDILSRRLDEPGDWVFPNTAGDGPIYHVRRWIVKVRETSGVEWTPHDLRRTFATIAESLDLSGYTLKRLLNHKTNNADTTSGYIVLDVERLRDPMERIALEILKMTGG